MGRSRFFGGFDQLGCTQLVRDMLAEAQGTPDAFALLTGSAALEGSGAELSASYPSIIDVAFQMAFAMITCAIITGSVAGRMKFGAVCAFVAVWVLAVYAPLAHMVWGGEGSLVGDMIGALDFAGGDVVHISSGLTGLILCLILGSRRGFAVMTYRPHNVPFVVLGATLLWFGWFGFNAGSEFAADGIAGLALLNTAVASAAALLSWMVVERVKVGKPTLVGAATGLVAGLVVITPAARLRRALGCGGHGRDRLSDLLLRHLGVQAEVRLRRRARRVRLPLRRRRGRRRSDGPVLRARAVVDRFRRLALHRRCDAARRPGARNSRYGGFRRRRRHCHRLRGKGGLRRQLARRGGGGGAGPRCRRAR